MSGKGREQAVQRRTKATESIQQELQACAWSAGRRRPVQMCGDEPFKEGLYEIRPKQAAPLWPRKRKKRERKREKRKGILVIRVGGWRVGRGYRTLCSEQLL